ncbi:hypothetical protein ACIQWA_02735 [Kitasatospora sp. NPDC098652]|uniref:hypothetical protein n=1 Tax=Kitasatospora sp. NPDC098652 TaxID=3364095 RepID=UPI003803317C
MTADQRTLASKLFAGQAAGHSKKAWWASVLIPAAFPVWLFTTDPAANQPTPGPDPVRSAAVQACHDLEAQGIPVQGGCPVG